MDPLVKPRMIRILNGRVDVMEALVAELGNDYAITHWHFYSDGPVGYATAVAIHGSVIRQMQIAQANLLPNGARR